MADPSDIQWDDDIVWDASPVAPEPPSALDPTQAKTQAGTALRSFGQGASFGFGDELRGLAGAQQELASRGPLGHLAATSLGMLGGAPGAIVTAANAPQLATGTPQQLASFSKDPLIDALLKRYRSDRDTARHEVAVGSKENPKTALVAQMAGGLTAPIPGGGAASLVKSGAGYGLASGLGGSEADLTQGDVGRAAQDTAAGGAFGAAGGAVAGGLGAIGSRFAKGGGARVGDIVQGKTAQVSDEVAKEVASLQGAYGSEVQKGSRYLENVQRGVSGVPASSAPSGISPQTQAQAIQALHSPEASALQTSVLENTMDALPAQAAAIERAKLALQSAKSGAPQEVAKRVQDYFNAPIMSKEVIPRVDRLKARLGTGAIGAATGAAAGGLYGLAAGEDVQKEALKGATLLGAGGLLQPTGLLSMVRNAATSPRIQAAAVEGVTRGAQAVGPMAGRISNAVQSPLKPEEAEAVEAFLDSSP